MLQLTETDDRVPLADQLSKEVGPVILINTFRRRRARLRARERPGGAGGRLRLPAAGTRRPTSDDLQTELGTGPSGPDDAWPHDDRVAVAVGEHRVGLGGDEVAGLDVAGRPASVGDVDPDDEVGLGIDLADLDLGDRRLVDGEVVEDPLGDHHRRRVGTGDVFDGDAGLGVLGLEKTRICSSGSGRLRESSRSRSIGRAVLRRR